jgi:hypothetical protein
MKIVNELNLSVDRMIIMLADREQDLYNQFLDMEKTFGAHSDEAKRSFSEWQGLYEVMQYMIIGVEDREHTGVVEI